MRAAIFNGPKDITVGNRPDPVITAPTDAVVRVVLACVCGSDLWYYRGESDHGIGSIGHEFIGVVEQVGDDAGNLETGDLVIAPFMYSDGTCPHCRNRALLNCVDVMSTGHHAAVSSGVERGDTVAVVGDGAVGLSAVLASARLGAGRIIALSRNPVRQALARAFGATDIVAVRGGEADEAVLELTEGVGVDAARHQVARARELVVRGTVVTHDQARFVGPAPS